MRRLTLTAIVFAGITAAVVAGPARARAGDCSEFSSWGIGPALRHSCEHLERLRDDPVYRQEYNGEIEAAIRRSDWERAKRNALIPHNDPGAINLCPPPHRLTAQDGCQ